MRSELRTPVGAHLNGSVALTDSEQVMRTVGEILGNHVHQIPDGETGERDNWCVFQVDVFANHADFELVPAPPGEYSALPQYRLREGVEADKVDLRPLGYLDAARASYDVFRRLKSEGAIPATVRFQVSLPTPLAPVAIFVSPEHRALVEPIYEAALARELRAIQEAIPADDLAVQFDFAVEVGMWEGLEGSGQFIPWFDDVRTGTIARAARMADQVAEPARLGLHLCYGDYGHEHFVQPTDTEILRDIANAFASTIKRPIDWIHMPVPRDRDDDAYFAPLESLRLDDRTELYLGLLHLADGADGARRRIATAQRHVETFGVAGECGLGREPSDAIPELLRLHAEVAAPRQG